MGKLFSYVVLFFLAIILVHFYKSFPVSSFLSQIVKTNLSQVSAPKVYQPSRNTVEVRTETIYVEKSHKPHTIISSLKSILSSSDINIFVSDVYTYKDYWQLDVPFLRKEAIVRVDASVQIGFDISELKTRVDDSDKSIYILSIPKAKVKHIEDNLEYVSVYEGNFNWFDGNDYNEFDNKTRQQLRDKIQRTDILQRADKQLGYHLEMLKILSQEMGWTLIYKL